MKGTAFVGNCSLHIIKPTEKTARMSYWIRTSRTGGGVATEAARLLKQFGLEKLGLTRIEILVAACNVRSQRVAQRIGAIPTKRNEHFEVRRKDYDAILFTVTRTDSGEKSM